MKAKTAIVGLLLATLSAGGLLAADAFAHRYTTYGEVLARHIRTPRVDCAGLEPRAADGLLDQRLQCVHPARHRRSLSHSKCLVTLQPRNSIRQIDGVWTELNWHAAGRTVTLDDIEHKILRPAFKDARIHFALNCASVSCPPLAAKPYGPDALGTQLDEAARTYLASTEGLRADGDTFRLSSIFKWYGDDFIAEYAPLVPGERPAKERAILGAIVKHAPPAAAERARAGAPIIEYLDYDWSLNDVRR